MAGERGQLGMSSEEGKLKFKISTFQDDILHENFSSKFFTFPTSRILLFKLPSQADLQLLTSLKLFFTLNSDLQFLKSHWDLIIITFSIEEVSRFFSIFLFWYIKVFDGNINRNSIVYHDLNPSIVGRYVRFRPIDWNGEIAMRVELFGCSGNFNGRTYAFMSSHHQAASRMKHTQNWR